MRPDPLDRLRTASAQVRARTQDRSPRGVRHDAAGEAGTCDTDDAIGFDPFPMLEVMQRSGANYVVFGQVAGILHGSVELTGDLDLLWDGDVRSVDRLASVFADAGVALRDEDFGLLEVADHPDALRGRKVYFEGLGSAGDLCTPRLPWGSLDVDAFLRRKVWATSGALAVPYLRLDDLITMREAVPGAKHRRRLLELRRLAVGHA